MLAAAACSDGGNDDLLGAKAVAERVSPSVAWVDSDGIGGSGVLVTGNYVITNAHIAQISPHVDLSFPDGTYLEDVPVVDTDQTRDLALLGPVEVDAEPLELLEAGAVGPGEPIYLVGYPGEVENRPQPAIVTGVFAREREMVLFDETFVQSSALIAGGQSGGAMVDAEGRLVAITGMLFSEARFGTGISAADVADALPELEAATGELGLQFGSDGTEFEFELEPLGTTAWVVWSDEGGETLSITADSADDIWIEVEAKYADKAEDHTEDLFIRPQTNNNSGSADEGTSGVEDLEVQLIGPGGYVVKVGSNAESLIEASMESNLELMPFADTEDGTRLDVDVLARGMFDFRGDRDSYKIDLVEGEQLRFVADALSDVALVLRDADGEVVVSVDDSRIGVYGTSAEAIVTIEETGSYTVEVGRTGDEFPGYGLLVESVG